MLALSKVDSVGIYFHKASGKWAAQIRNGPDVFHIGLFKHKISAARAYDRMARKLGKKHLNMVDPND